MAEETKKQRRSSARVVTTSNNIKFEAPKGRRKPKPKTTVVASKVAARPVSGFVEFIREHAIVGLAIGFIVGAQARVLVDQLVKSFVDPAAGLLVGGAGTLSSKTASLHHDGHVTVFAWGAFVYSLIDFIGVLIVVYVVIKIFNLDKLDKKKED
jgi:large-conductance mechanosensitive channel